jgi:hypothetical protein
MTSNAPPAPSGALTRYDIGRYGDSMEIDLTGDWVKYEDAVAIIREQQAALATVLAHCDVASDGETVYERAVIEARAVLAKYALEKP